MIMRQSRCTLATEEPDALVGHVRDCGGPGGQPPGLPGLRETDGCEATRRP